MDETIKQLDALLQEGRTEDVIKQSADPINSLTSKMPEGFQAPLAEIVAIRGMAFYRRKEFENAREDFRFVLMTDPANERAIYGMAYLAAYVDKDLEKVYEWTEKLPESPARDNARVIFARSPEFINLPDAENWVHEAFERWVNPNPEDPLNVANVCHNAARFYLAKEGNEIDTMANCSAALAFLTAALGFYGAGNMNLHHRTEASYWTSVAMEKLLGPAAALAAAEQSLNLWKRQTELDPTNPHFVQNYENAMARVDELRKNASSLERHSL